MGVRLGRPLRQPCAKHNLSVILPLLSRVRVLGMQGINFTVDEEDEEEVKPWRDVYMLEQAKPKGLDEQGYSPQMYDGREPDIRWAWEVSKDMPFWRPGRVRWPTEMAY